MPGYVRGRRRSACGCASAFGRAEAPSAQFFLVYEYGQDFAWAFPILSPPPPPKEMKGELVTGDPEFRSLEGEIKVHWVK